MTDQDLIHRYLEDPAALGEPELEQLIALLRADSKKAVELREQLILDDLLGQKLAVDRKNFIIMVQQRLTDYEKGEEEVYNQVADLRAIAEAEIERKVRPPGINPWIKFAGGISLIAVALAVVVAWQFQASAPRSVANVEELSGQVVRQSGAREDPLRLGQALSTGDTIVASAGSTVVWKYKDGTSVRLLGDSDAKISADSTQAKQIRLDQGELIASVAKQARGPMVFTTPHALATVRGTQLRLVVGEANTQLDVAEGRVDFQRHSGSQVLQLTANESGIATAVNIGTREVLWPVNRAAAAFVQEGVDGQLVRNLESGNLKVTVLEEDSVEAGKTVLSLVKQTGEFGCDILFTPGKVASNERTVLCSLGPLGRENFMLQQQGENLQLYGASSSTPIVIELGEVILGKPHYVSLGFKEGRVSVVVDGVQVIESDEFQISISTWEDGPLNLKADAGGNRTWQGEIRALALFNQFVDKSLSDANRARFKQLNP